MFRKILAGTDGSDTARLAIAHAVHLAIALDAELTVVSVRSTEEGTAAATAQIARGLLRDVENEYREQLDIRTRLLEGDPAGGLVRLAAEEQFDLLVVGNRGMARVTWTPERSVPGRLAKRLPAALLIVDSVGGRQPGYERILVAVDGSPHSDRVLEEALSLASGLGAAVTVATPASSEPAGQAVLAPLRARWPLIETTVLQGPPVDALCDLAESGGHDLVVLAHRAAGGARRFLGTVPDRVSRRARTSVLIVNATE